MPVFRAEPKYLVFHNEVDYGTWPMELVLSLTRLQGLGYVQQYVTAPRELVSYAENVVSERQPKAVLSKLDVPGLTEPGVSLHSHSSISYDIAL